MAIKNIKYIYKKRKTWYNNDAKQKTNNDLKENALLLEGVLYPFAFLRKLVNNGKNVDSANLRMVFSISLVFCLATIGVGVFRCVGFS